MNPLTDQHQRVLLLVRVGHDAVVRIERVAGRRLRRRESHLDLLV